MALELTWNGGGGGVLLGGGMGWGGGGGGGGWGVWGGGVLGKMSAWRVGRGLKMENFRGKANPLLASEDSAGRTGSATAYLGGKPYFLNGRSRREKMGKMENSGWQGNTREPTRFLKEPGQNICNPPNVESGNSVANRGKRAGDGSRSNVRRAGVQGVYGRKITEWTKSRL